jgi:hypothetical protein
MLPKVARGQAALQQARRHVQDRIAQLTPKAVDKTDVVAFFRRESIRDELRSLPRERRDQLLSRHSANLDAEIALAVLEAVELPWAADESRLVSAETRKALQRRMISAEHGDDLEQIEEIEKAIEYASPTIDKARAEIQANLGMSQQEFEQMARLEAAKQVVWIKRIGDKVVTIIPESESSEFSTSRPATADDIANGRYFSDIKEYRAALAGAA